MKLRMPRRKPKRSKTRRQTTRVMNAYATFKRVDYPVYAGTSDFRVIYPKDKFFKVAKMGQEYRIKYGGRTYPARKSIRTTMSGFAVPCIEFKVK